MAIQFVFIYRKNNDLNESFINRQLCLFDDNILEQLGGRKLVSCQS